MKNITISTYNTFPINTENELFYEIQLLPSINILRMKDYEWVSTELESNYIAITFCWLFWSVEFVKNIK